MLRATPSGKDSTGPMLRIQTLRPRESVCSPCKESSASVSLRTAGTHPQDTEVTSQGEFCPSGKESRVIVSCGQLGTHPQGTVGCAPRNCAGLAMPPHAICRRRTAAPPWQGVQVQLPLRASSQLNERFYFAIILGR